MNTHKEPSTNYMHVVPNSTKEFIKEVIECDFCGTLHRWGENHTCGNQIVELEPTPPSQIEEEPSVGATLEILATQRASIVEKLVNVSWSWGRYKDSKALYQQEIDKIDKMILELRAINKLTKEKRDE